METARFQLGENNLFIHYSGGPNGPFLTVSFPIREDREGQRYVHFEDYMDLENLQDAMGVDLETTFRKEMGDDNDNCVTLNELLELADRW